MIINRELLIKNWPNCGHKCKGVYDCGCKECQGWVMYGREKWDIGVDKILPYLKNETFYIKETGCRLPIELRPTGCLECDCGR